MGLAKRASLSAALTAPSDLPPAADLSTICIVRRNKGPAAVVSLADSRPAGDPAQPAGDGMFYRKGSATASTFRPAYWSYEPDPSQVAGPVASLERQLDARRRSPVAAPIETKAEEKPLASLDAAPEIRRLTPSTEPVAPVPDQPAPRRTSPAPAELDTNAVQALLRRVSDALPMLEEAEPPAPIVEAAPVLEAPPLDAVSPGGQPTVAPVELSPPDAPPLALPIARPPSVEVPVVAPPPAMSASVAIESPAPPAPSAGASKAEPSRPATAPAGKRPVREPPKRAEPDAAELDALGATIDSVLATRWYGSERSSLGVVRERRNDIAPVTPSTLIAELATIRTDPEPVATPTRGRRVRIIVACSLVAVFALAFAAALLWRTGHGSMLPMRLRPALLGVISLPEATLALAEVHGAARESAALSS